MEGEKDIQCYILIGHRANSMLLTLVEVFVKVACHSTTATKLTPYLFIATYSGEIKAFVKVACHSTTATELYNSMEELNKETSTILIIVIGCL